MEKKLYRDPYNKVIGGVCAGLGEYFDTDVTIIRLLFGFGFFIMGVGFIPYIILWIVLPKKTYNPFTTPSNPLTVNYIVPPVMPGTPMSALPPKRSNAGLIVGMVLIFFGFAYLMNEFDLIPEIQLHRFWPVILVAVGIALIVKGQQKKPWEEHNWHNGGIKTEPADTETTTNDNNPTL